MSMEVPLGDDLDDGLVYEIDDSVDYSENAEISEEEPTKRVLEDAEDETSSLHPTSKRQKKLAKSSLHQKKLEKMKYEKQQKEIIPKSSAETIAEYFATLIRERNPDLSALELDEMYLKKSNFISTETYKIDRTLENFPNFLESFSKSPRAIVLSLSNIRVADLFRTLGGANKAVKLFSKTKLKDDLIKLEYLLNKNEKTKENKKKNKNTDTNIRYFISTPNRLSKIIESTDILFQGKEKLDIYLDASYLDPKMNTILTSEDSMVLCKVLKEFLTKKSSVKVLLF